MRRLLPALVALTGLAAAGSGQAAAARTFVIEGRGWGHGVGMSQYGAQGFALRGYSFRRILAHYYPGTRLTRLPARRVRVLLAEGRRRVVISAKSSLRATDARGVSRTLRPGRYGLRAPLAVRFRGKRVRLTPPVTFDPGFRPLSLDGAAYRGSLVVHRSGASLSVVNDVRLERYVRGVVPWEMPDHWHPHALAAQAVAARSYALATLDPGRTYDLVADTRDQVYGGIRAEEDSTNRAIALTSGLVLTWSGRVALTLYCSTSGGRTAALPHGLPGNEWVPYLVARPDPYDALSPHHRWGPLVYNARTLARRLGLPAVTSVRAVRNGSGRVASVEARWAGGKRWLPGRDVARALDLRSTWFTIRPAGGRPNSEPKTRANPKPAPPRTARPWTVVLASVRHEAAAERAAARARRARLPRVRVVRSSRYSSLRAGFVVVASGAYRSRAHARAAAVHARQVFPGAYAQRLRP